MFTVRPTDHPSAGFELADDSADASAAISPARGAITTRLRVRGQEILYLDEATLLDPSKNVRGGIPVLFPSPGRLQGDRYQRGGAQGVLGQHGFARNRAWKVGGTATARGAELTLILESDEQTRQNYPFDFRLELTFLLANARLRIEQRVFNLGSQPLPFGIGFHPYFRVPQASKASARIPTPATRAWDNAAKREIPLAGPVDLTASEVDLHLIDHGSSQCALTWDGGGQGVELRGSAELTRWVIWTLAGKDFICLEPWSCPGNALNTGEGLLEVAPGSDRRLWLEIEPR